MDARQVVSEVGLWWPSADEDGVRAAAASWEHTAAELDRAAETGRAGVASVRAGWAGAASEAFAASWHGHETALRDDATGARAVGAALRRYADAVADAKRRVVELAVTAGATIVAGLGLAWLTFGASAAAAAGISAGLVAAAEAIGVELSATAAAIAGGAVAGTLFGAGEAALVDAAVTQPLRVEAFGDGGWSGAEVAGAAEAGGLFGAVLGGAAGVTTSTAGVAPGTTRAADSTMGATTATDDLAPLDGMITAALDPGGRGSLGPLFRPGVHQTPTAVLDPGGLPAARLLESEGFSVHARGGTPTSALVRGSPTDRGRVVELAQPDAPSADAVENTILEAGGRLGRQGHGDLVLDGRGAGLGVDAAGEGLAEAVERAAAQGLDLPDSIRFVLDGTSIYYP